MPWPVIQGEQSPPWVARNSDRRRFNPLTQITALHAVWASDPAWTNPGNGNPVTSWRNQSGGGDPAAADAARPTFRVSTAAFNNRSTVQFVAASTQYLDVDVADTAQPYKVVIVGSLGGTGAAERFLGVGGNAGRLFGDSAANEWLLNAGAQIVGGTSDNNPHVFRLTLNGASSQLWVDEVSALTGDISTTAFARFTLGAGSNAVPAYANHLNGHLAFVGIYAGGTSDALLTSLCLNLKGYYGTP